MKTVNVYHNVLMLSGFNTFDGVLVLPNFIAEAVMCWCCQVTFQHCWCCQVTLDTAIC